MKKKDNMDYMTVTDYVEPLEKTDPPKVTVELLLFFSQGRHAIQRFPIPINIFEESQTVVKIY